MRRLLCICYDFPPEVNPTSIRTAKLLGRLSAQFRITVITATAQAKLDGVTIRYVAPREGAGFFRTLRRLRLEKLSEMLEWPDDKRLWVGPAVAEASRVIEAERTDAIAVFMMPYAAGFVGARLKRRHDIPLILNWDDSPTCSDMHETFPTRLHYAITRKLEDSLVRRSDAAIYVSGFNLKRVRDRQPPRYRQKFHLVRYGADPADFAGSAPPSPDNEFRIAYIGGMTGWMQFYHGAAEASTLRELYKKWMSFGRYRIASLDQRSSSPYFIAKAAQAVAARRPELRGRLSVSVYGNKYPQQVIDRALANGGLAGIVSVHGVVSNTEAIRIARGADLLFIALPDRTDGSAGGRISAKTYEYLMSDRPILAALPPGENRDYLAGKPGVFLVNPMDERAMSGVIEQLALQKRAGAPARFDRAGLRDELSYDARAGEFSKVIADAITSHKQSRATALAAPTGLNERAEVSAR